MPLRPVLVTCGATRNPLDAIRTISASSSGRTGVAAARGLAARGHAVHLLGSPEAALRVGEGEGISTEVYTSTRDLMARMEAWVRANPGGAVIHSAAVGDYEADPAERARKIPSGQDELVLRLRRAPKIADRIVGWDPSCLLVTFKAAGPETTAGELVKIARAQLTRTGSALVFANVIGALGSSVILVGPEKEAAYPERAAAIDALVARVSAG